VDSVLAAAPPEEETRPAGAGARLRARLRYLLEALRALWRKFVRWLLGRRERAGEGHRGRRREVRAPIPAGGPIGRLWRVWEKRVLDRGTSAEESLMLRRGMSREQIQAARQYDPEGYKQAAESAVYEEFRARQRDLRRQLEEEQRKATSADETGREAAKIRREALKQQMEVLAKEQESLEAEEKRKAGDRAQEAVRDDLVREMEEAGYVVRKDGRIEITTTLVERYAQLILLEELGSMPASAQARLQSHGVSTGIYEKGRKRSSIELDRMDILATRLASRIRQPKVRMAMDEDVAIVARELLTNVAHVVILLDRSGSMGQSDRLENAKRAALALYRAVKDHDRKNVVDIVTYDNEVAVLDLQGVWRCAPGSFTNTGAALRTAASLLSTSRADRKMVYLITDGLPEAYTTKAGRVQAGDLPAAMEDALGAASSLRKVKGVRATTILLESTDARYLEAATKLSDALEGPMFSVEGRRLAREMLSDYAEARRPREVEVAAGARKRRRKQTR
jgi:Mg-chelatase subunit ChlD